MAGHGGRLVRCDGARFTIFNRTNTSGINANRCDQLLETRDGTLWILTDQGLISYRDRTFHSYTSQDGFAGDLFATGRGSSTSRLRLLHRMEACIRVQTSALDFWRNTLNTGKHYSRFESVDVLHF